MFRPSLTLRLTLAFTLLVAITSALVSVSLYRSLYAELVWRDNQTLVNRGAQLRQLLLDGAEPQALPLYFNRMMDTRLDVLRIDRPGRGTVVEVNQAGVAIPGMAPVPAGIPPSARLLHHWRTAHGEQVAGLALRGSDQVGDVTISVARVSTDRDRVLARYRQNSLIISLVAILLAGIASPLLIRRSLRAIATLSQQTARTDSRQLASPLALETLPAELLPLGQSLNVMRQRLAEDFSRLTQFADDLAHELRTPVNILLGQNQVMLQRPRNPAEYQALLGSNIEELEHLTRLIENILFLSRADHRNVALNPQRIDLARFISDVVDFLEPLAEERELRVEVSATGEVEADKLLLQRVLTNLMTNALRHAPEGDRILIRAEPVAHGVTITVANRGAPIDHPEKIFTRFWRGDDARHSPGTGLGLAMSQAIATLHRGQLSLSHENGWNRFTLWLPRS